MRTASAAGSVEERRVHWVRDRVIEFCDRHFSLAGRASLDGTAVRKILVLQLQQVGDSVIFTPALRAIRQRYPNARLDLLVNRVSWQLYRRIPHVDHMYVDERSRVGRVRVLPLVPLLLRVRRQGYDCVVADVPQQAFRYSLIALLTGARVRVGFNVAGRGFLYHVQLRCAAGSDYLRCNLQVAKALGADADLAREEIHYDASDAAHASVLLSNAGADRARLLYVIHPGSNWQSKTWFPERWAAVADELIAGTGAAVVFVGTAAEHGYVEAIRKRMVNEAHSVAGRTDLSQLAALLDRADLFLGTDSGPRHIAGALGRSQVTVMSSLDRPQRWVLSRPREVVLRTDPPCSPCFLHECSHRRCMDLITVDRVVDASRTLRPNDFAFRAERAAARR